MRNRLYIISGLCLLLAACSPKPEKMLDNFQSVYEITHTKLDVDPVALVSFGRLLLFEKEGFIIKENYQGDVPLSRIFYTRDSVVPFIRRGNGPNEYLQPRIMQRESDSSLYILDDSQSKISLLSTDGSGISELKPENLVLNAISLDNQYIVSCYSGSDKNARYTLLDSKGMSIMSFGRFPEDNIDAPNRAKQLAYQGYMVRHPHKKQVAFASSFGALFDIYEIEGNTIRTVVERHEVLPSYTNSSFSNITDISYKKDNVFGYGDLYATEKYIYALFSGKTIEDVQNKDIINAKSTQDILVYDWEGKPLFRLHTDIGILNLCVSRDNNFIIGLFYDNEEYGLCSFDLSVVASI